MKKRGRETTKLKGRNALPVARHRGPTAADLQKQLDQRTRELADAQKHLAEALEQQTATSEVLQVISSSPGELEPVFQAMLANAARLCEAESASLILREGSDLRIAARYNAPAALLQQMERDPIFRPGPASGLGRSIRLKQVVQVPDIVNDQAYFYREPARVRGVEAGYRSQLSEPIREVLESDESDVIPCRALDSLLRSARCGHPNTALRRTAVAFVTPVI